MQAARAVAEPTARTLAGAVMFALHRERKVGLDITARARHLNIGVDIERQPHVDIAARGGELHPSIVVDAGHLDIDIAARALAAYGARHATHTQLPAGR